MSPPSTTRSNRWALGLFGAGVALLALNDLVWKGGGLLPAAVTGKLSDVAGLLVAPLVLATLLGVRTRSGWLRTHVAVGLVFALIQTALGAQLFVASLGVLGRVARAWPDVTDLLALPALGVSYRWLEPGLLRGPKSARWSAGRGALLLAAALLCVGSQDQINGPPPRYPFPVAGALEADVIARYTGRTDTRMTVRRVPEATELDCDAVLEDPRGALAAVSFGDEQEWTLAPGDAIPLWDRREAHDRECYAIHLVRGGQTWIVAWRHGTPPMQVHDIRLDEGDAAEPTAVRLPDEPGEAPLAPEGVRLVDLVP